MSGYIEKVDRRQGPATVYKTRVEMFLKTPVRVAYRDGLESKMVFDDAINAIDPGSIGQQLDGLYKHMGETITVETPHGLQDVRGLDRKSLMLFLMRVQTPKAKVFQDWALEVLEQAGTKGYYVPPGGDSSPVPQASLVSMAKMFLESAERIEAIEQRQIEDQGKIAKAEDMARAALAAHTRDDRWPVSVWAKYNNVDLTEGERKAIGGWLKTICEERGIRLGEKVCNGNDWPANAYPRWLLEELWPEIVRRWKL